MSLEIEHFINNPQLLLELVRDVVDRIDNESDEPDKREKEAQLQAIAKAIQQLEKMEIPVPDALRAEKTRLAASLGNSTQVEQTLQLLSEGLDQIAKDINARLGNNSQPDATKKRRKRSRAPKTDMQVLRKNILKALRTLGGRARVSEIIEEMGRLLDGKLLPGDMEWRESTKEYAWQNNTKWERFRMTQDGLLRKDSPRGYWELEEEQK